MSTPAGLRVAVVGLGPMGRGIARVFHRCGADVLVVDVTDEAARKGLELASQEAEADGESFTAAVTTLEKAAAQAELIVEAIVENMDAKRELLAVVARHASESAIVASNTSSLSVGEMGRAFGAPDRVVGMHFFNPPTRMRLVEVINGPATSEATTARAVELVEALGKTPVVCRDSPNFIVNRICRPLYYEAQLLVTQGVPVPVVDAAARLGLGHRMGPLELLDFTGLHTHLASSETALREFGDPRYRPIPLARQLVRAGATGRAAGRGFYDHALGKPREHQAAVVRPPGERPSVRVQPAGPDAAALRRLLRDEADRDEPIHVYRCASPLTEADVAAVHELARTGTVVVDSADAGWVEALPDGVGWVRLHPQAAAPFAELVDDPLASVLPTPATETLLDALGAASVRVPALPGLVVERLLHCLVNEATTVVEEGTAAPDDVDVALRLAMNHPLGPFEVLARDGAPVVYGSLRSMLSALGDPRYRPSQYLRRAAAGARRR